MSNYRFNFGRRAARFSSFQKISSALRRSLSVIGCIRNNLSIPYCSAANCLRSISIRSSLVLIEVEFYQKRSEAIQ